MKPAMVGVVAAMLLTLCAGASALAAETVERPNMLGAELLGRGVVLTVNYERCLPNHFGAGAGLMAIGASGGGITILPLYVSYAPGKIHSPYVAVGGTLLGGGGSVQDFNSTWLMTVSVGYQYKSAAGFFVRPMFSYLAPTVKHEADDYIIWPGVTIGGSF